LGPADAPKRRFVQNCPFFLEESAAKNHELSPKAKKQSETSPDCTRKWRETGINGFIPEKLAESLFFASENTDLICLV
jgi:hypothetical protein